ncbi:MAG: hypothetical protein M1820_008800 [Bogoriella megaspora]|nr:MAG: hypothetical protein M1820_008800 [Bogoriella megaspora]
MWQKLADGDDGPPVSPLQLTFPDGKDEVKRILTQQAIPLDNESIDDGPKETSRLQDSPHAAKLWTPFFLTKKVLLGFLFIFVALTVAVAVLYEESRKKSGLGTVADPSKDSHVWSWARTILIAILTLLWGQVEYRAKQIAPWQALAQGPTPARNSLMLDYISPWSGQVLLMSLRARHWPVFLATLGKFILTMLSLFSTGFLTLDTVILPQGPMPFTVNSAFDAGGFKQSDIDGRVYEKFYGMKQYSLSFPPGTSDQYAFQTFHMPASDSPLVNATVQATLDVFQAGLSCETAFDRTTLTSSNGKLTATSGPYTIVFQNIDGKNASIDILAEQMSNCSAHQSIQPMDGVSIYGVVTGTNCDGDTGEPPSYDWNDDWSAPIGGFYNLVIGLIDNSSDTSDPSHLRATMLICKPQYGVQPGSVELSNGQFQVTGPVDIVLGENPRPGPLLNMSGSNVFDSVHTALTKIPSELAVVDEWSTAAGFQSSDPMFIAFNISSPQSNVSNWMDPKVLEQAADETFSTVAVQIASMYWMKSSSNTVDVMAFGIPQLRVVAQRFAVGFVETLLGLMIIITALLVAFGKFNVVSRDPGSLAGLAAILSKSHKLQDQLSLTGSSSRSGLQRTLMGYQYRTTISEEPGSYPTFSIKQSLSSQYEPNHFIENRPKGAIKWYRPWFASAPVQLAAIIFPIALLGTLEGLYDRSRNRNGLVDIDAHYNYTQYVWLYIPAIFVLSVLAMFNSIDFFMKLFHPFCTLCKGAAPAKNSIMDQPLSYVPEQSILNSILKRQPTLFATAVGVIASVVALTAVNGLYSVQMTQSVSPFTISQADTFNASLQFIPQAAQEAQQSTLGLPGLIEMSNMTTPPFTYENYAFTHVTYPPDSLPESGGPPPILSASVPAVRGIMNCSLVPQNQVSLSSKPDMLNISIPASCSTSGSDTSITANWDTSQVGYQASIKDATNGTDVSPSCAIYLAIWGYRDSSDSQWFRAATCAPYYQSVSVQTSFLLPSLTIFPTSPPIPDESTAKNITDSMPLSSMNPPDGASPSINTTNTYIDLTHSFPSRNFSLLTASGINTTALDPFFAALVYGLHGTPAPELFNSSDPLSTLNSMSTLYGLAAAQHASSHLRAAAPYPNPKISATLTNPMKLRLVQNTVPTRILQVSLAIATVSAIAAFWLLDTRYVLPKNPCSIAGAASLLAGSEVVREGGLLSSAGGEVGGRYGLEMSDGEAEEEVWGVGGGRGTAMGGTGVEWWSDKEMVRRGVWDGWVFSMGWWEGRKGERTSGRRFGVDVGKAERDG